MKDQFTNYNRMEHFTSFYNSNDDGNFDVSNWFKIYINGLFIPSEKYTYYVSSSANQVEFNFSTGSIGTATSTTLGYEITGSDEFGIVGKFKEL